MSFIGLEISSDSPVPLRLDDGGVFNIKRVVLSPNQSNTGKVYLYVNIPNEDVDYEDEEGKIDLEKMEDRVPICVLESGKHEQETLDLNFPWTQDLVFSVSATKPGTKLYVSGQMDIEDDDEDEDDHHHHHHDGEECSEDDEEFLDDGEFDSDILMDFDGEDSDEEIPELVPIKKNNKKATITEIVEETKPTPKKEEPKKVTPVTPDTSNANGAGNKKNKNKKNKEQSTEQQQPQQPKEKPAKQQPKEKQPQQPKEKTAKQPQQPKEKPAKQQPKEKQPQQPNKKRDLDGKEPNTNATKKSKNNAAKN